MQGFFINIENFELGEVYKKGLHMVFQGFF